MATHTPVSLPGEIPWRGAWRATVHGAAELDQLRWLSTQAQSDSFPSDYSIGYCNLFSVPNTAPAKVTNDLSAPSTTDARHPPGLQHRWSVLLSPRSPLTLVFSSGHCSRLACSSLSDIYLSLGLFFSSLLSAQCSPASVGFKQYA